MGKLVKKSTRKKLSVLIATLFALSVLVTLVFAVSMAGADVALGDEPGVFIQADIYLKKSISFTQALNQAKAMNVEVLGIQSGFAQHSPAPYTDFVSVEKTDTSERLIDKMVVYRQEMLNSFFKSYEELEKDLLLNQEERNNLQTKYEVLKKADTKTVEATGLKVTGHKEAISRLARKLDAEFIREVASEEQFLEPTLESRDCTTPSGGGTTGVLQGQVLKYHFLTKSCLSTLLTVV